MKLRIEPPLITGKSDQEKIEQITRYLYKLAERLNIVISDAEKEGTDNDTGKEKRT